MLFAPSLMLILFLISEITPLAHSQICTPRLLTTLLATHQLSCLLTLRILLLLSLNGNPF